MGHRRDGLIRWLAVVLTALLLLAGAKALADAGGFAGGGDYGSWEARGIVIPPGTATAPGMTATPIPPPATASWTAG